MRRSILLPLAIIGLGSTACGPGEARETIEDRPLEHANALDAIADAFASRGAQSERHVSLRLADGKEWNVDVASTNMPIAVEYLTAQDRERIGASLPIPATPDEMPHVVIAERLDASGQPAGRLYVRTFTDEHFRYQPNPPADMMEAPYTIREVTARLKRDVVDFVAWHVTEHGATNAP